ncbi:MAG: hypothetical protein IKF47_03705 [Bacilli bacterium]|nr:hypothetical protein [Bacilli bacterium]
MTNITYVTGNYGKYISIKEKFEKHGIDIKYANIDLEEPDVNDIEFISKEKARLAYEQLGTPVFVVDCGFYIKNYPNNPNYPGAFVKRSGVASNISKLIEDMKDVDDRYCYFLNCLTYYDGKEFVHFFGKNEGQLSKEIKGVDLKQAWSNLWHVFIPKNCDKTLAEMTDYERNNRDDDRTDAAVEFIEWLNKEKGYQKNKTRGI